MAQLAVTVVVSKGNVGFYRLVGALHRRNFDVVSLASFDDGNQRVVVIEMDIRDRTAESAVALIEREPLVESVRTLRTRSAQFLGDRLSAVAAEVGAGR